MSYFKLVIIPGLISYYADIVYLKEGMWRKLPQLSLNNVNIVEVKRINVSETPVSILLKGQLN